MEILQNSGGNSHRMISIYGTKWKTSNYCATDKKKKKKYTNWTYVKKENYYSTEKKKKKKNRLIGPM